MRSTERPGTRKAWPWLRVPEAAEMRCKPQRIHDLLSAGRLSRFKEGGGTLVFRAELEALVSADRVAQVLPIAPRTHGYSPSGLSSEVSVGGHTA
jgi:hypothetical protein